MSPLPSELALLTNLSTLHLAGNQLNGTIPDFLGTMTTLTHLDIGSNSFSGTVPESLGNLTNLQYFFVATNNLNGAGQLISSMFHLLFVLQGRSPTSFIVSII